MRFDSMLRMADKLMLYKYIVKNVAKEAGYTVTFMPKPIFQDNGSGMHVHQSLWKGGQPLFFDETGYAGLSDMARWYIGGLLNHTAAILAFAAPTTNSYKRLVPGYEAPVNLLYSQRHRWEVVRDDAGAAEKAAYLQTPRSDLPSGGAAPGGRRRPTARRFPCRPPSVALRGGYPSTARTRHNGEVTKGEELLAEFRR